MNTFAWKNEQILSKIRAIYKRCPSFVDELELQAVYNVSAVETLY